MRIWLRTLGGLGALCGAFGVGLAAAGAHLSGEPAVTTAAYFLLFHAAAITALVALVRERPDPFVLGATSLILLGVLLFSGDLATRGLAHVVIAHKMAPTGGVLLILGWLATAIALVRNLGRSAHA